MELITNVFFNKSDKISFLSNITELTISYYLYDILFKDYNLLMFVDNTKIIDLALRGYLIPILLIYFFIHIIFSAIEFLIFICVKVKGAKNFGKLISLNHTTREKIFDIPTNKMLIGKDFYLIDLLMQFNAIEFKASEYFITEPYQKLMSQYISDSSKPQVMISFYLVLIVKFLFAFSISYLSIKYNFLFLAFIIVFCVAFFILLLKISFFLISFESIVPILKKMKVFNSEENEHHTDNQPIS